MVKKKSILYILFCVALLLAFMGTHIMAAPSYSISSVKVNNESVSRGGTIEKAAVTNLNFRVDVTFDSSIPSDDFVYYVELNVDSETTKRNISTGSSSYAFTDYQLPAANRSYGVEVVLYQVDSANAETVLDTYSFTYTIGDLDTQAPVLNSHTPAANAVDVARNAQIVMNFNEPVSVKESGVYIQKSGSTTKLSAAFSYSNGDQTVTITPNQNLDFGSTYKVTIEANSITDVAGNALSARNWSFSTLTDPSAPPTITSRSPAANATGVKTNAEVVVAISKMLDTDTVTSSAITLKQGSTTIPVILVAKNVGGTGEITLTPVSPLNYNTTYTVAIASNTIKDSNGLALASTSWSFTTEAGSVLSITSRYPAANSTNFEIDDVITMTFNNRLNSSTVTSSNVYLRRSGSTTNISASLRYTDSTRTVSITPNNSLASNTKYDVYVSGNLRDISGNNILATNWSFTTKVQDPLYVTDRTPRPNALDQSVDTEIVVKFSQPLQSSTVTSSNVYLRKSGSTRNISAELKYTSSTRTVTLIPSSNLDYDTDYIVYLTNGIRDTSGNRLTAINWRFTTKEEDPVIISERTPSSNAKDVAVDTAITIRFSQAMNQSTLTTSNIYVRKSGTTRNITADISYNSTRRTVTLTPASDLDYNADYVVYVNNRVRDTSGNYLTAVDWKFSTVATAPFEVTYVLPANNQINVALDSSITAFLSASLNQNTLNTSNAYIRDNASNVYVPVTLTYTSTDKKVTMKPQASLKPNTMYTVVLTSGLRSTDGGSLKAYNWTFMTGGEPVRYGTSSSPELKAQGRYVDFPDVRPYVKNGRTFLPFRALFETIGANVGYDFSNASRLKVWGEKDGNRVELFIGDTRAYRNGTVLIMDVKPELVDERTMIPVRFAAEALGLKVTWDEATKTVIIE